MRCRNCGLTFGETVSQAYYSKKKCLDGSRHRFEYPPQTWRFLGATGVAILILIGAAGFHYAIGSTFAEGAIMLTVVAVVVKLAIKYARPSRG